MRIELRAFPSGAVYGATKAADKGFAEALRHELSGTGVTVSTVLFGEVETSLRDHQPDKVPDWRRSDNAISGDRLLARVRGPAAAPRRD